MNHFPPVVWTADHAVEMQGMKDTKVIIFS
jgi:hypothetical protein